MVDEYTKGGIRRKRPIPGDPEEVHAATARIERKARLRVPLRKRLQDEPAYQDGAGDAVDDLSTHISIPVLPPLADEQVRYDQQAPDFAVTKADIREREDDSRREKNATLREKRVAHYAEENLGRLEQIADKAQRRDAILDAREVSQLRRNALLDGEKLPELDALPEAASPKTIRYILRRTERPDWRNAAKSPRKADKAANVIPDAAPQGEDKVKSSPEHITVPVSFDPDMPTFEQFWEELHYGEENPPPLPSAGSPEMQAWHKTVDAQQARPRWGTYVNSVQRADADSRTRFQDQLTLTEYYENLTDELLKHTRGPRNGR